MSRLLKQLGIVVPTVIGMIRAGGVWAQCLPAPLETATLTAEPQAVFVQWFGPIGVCPQLGADFEVDSAEPPNVTLKTLVKDGVQIEQWRVGRAKQVLLPGVSIPRDLGSVKSNWNAEANPGIIVRIGTVLPGYPVAILQGTEGVAVNIAAPESVGGNDPWSSVEIQTVGDVRGSVFVHENSTHQGGRIRGTIGQTQGVVGGGGDDDPQIEAWGIGEGATGGTQQNPIVLRVGTIWNMHLKELNEGSRLEAGDLGHQLINGIPTGGRLIISGPLDGVIRLQSLTGASSPSQPSLQPTKIHIEALDLSAEDPVNAPRLESKGKIIIAGGDLLQDPLPCGGQGEDPCPYLSGTWTNAEIAIDSDFSGQIYSASATLGSFFLESASVKIGRSTSPGMGGKLKASGRIRTFAGNYGNNDPVHFPPGVPVENVITAMHVEIFGDTEAGSLVEFGGQLGWLEGCTVHGDHNCTIRAMYFYASYASAAVNAQIHVYNDLGGTIETVNMTDEAQHGGFRDNGTIIVEGDVRPTGLISHAGHVGPQHLTDIRKNFYGTYWAIFGAQKKYAGTLHIHGNSTGQIEIHSSMDSMNFNNFTEMKGGSIKIDGDMTFGYIKLLGSNFPPCAWLCYPSISPYDETACEPPCGGLPGCSGHFHPGCLDVDFCPTACSCLPPPDPLCDEQTAVGRENGIQHPGSLVDGSVVIGGSLTGTALVYLSGDIGEHGTIRIGSITGSDGVKVEGGVRLGGSITVTRGFTYGSIAIPGDMAGTITVGSLGPPPSGESPPEISVGGNLTGALNVNGVMKNALINLNTVLQDPLATTTGQVNIGTSSTHWTSVGGIVDFGNINLIWGAGGLATFRGCFAEPTDWFQSLCPADQSHIVTSFCAGATATVRCYP